MVSIVLVTYNRAARLRLSIQDVLDQTFKDFELIICDDCSPDGTEAVCREFMAKDPRIRYYRHACNQQMPANCNFGIRMANHEYIAILHDGDRFHAELIAQWYAAISQNNNVGLVFNSMGIADENNSLISSYHDFEEGIVDRCVLLKKVYFRRWRLDSPVYGEVMVRKKLLEEHGFFKREFGFYADVDFWMQILHSNDAYYCEETLIASPTKAIQPRLFEDNLVIAFLYLFNMHLKHRKIAFKDNPMKLITELAIFCTQMFFNINYILILMVKNQPFNAFLDCGRLLKKRKVFLIPWAYTLFAYPVIYPLLKIFTRVKPIFLKHYMSVENI